MTCVRFLSTPSARRATLAVHSGLSLRFPFLSTPSARRATKYSGNDLDCHEISIHALREEGDFTSVKLNSYSRHFYPRPPRGGRPFYASVRIKLSKIFLSTPSARRATYIDMYYFFVPNHFYPRPPRGGRPHISLVCPICWVISIHALREEGDDRVDDHKVRLFLFLSTPSARRATAKTERKPSAFVSLYTSLHKLQRDACKTNRKITPLLAQTAGVPVRSVPENHVCCRFALAGHQKISTLSWANSGCSPTCSTFV